jgi:hypothetical protein
MPRRESTQMRIAWNAPPEATHPHLNNWADVKATPYVGWAYASAEGTQFLSDQDAATWSTGDFHGCPTASVDIAAVRSVAGNASTSIDLCAAALGHLYCGATTRAFDFGNFTRDKQGTRRRAALPSAADAWISNVEKDSDYVLLDELRDPMIHRHLVRTHHVSTHTPPHLLQRTSFHLPSGPVDARVAIERCVAVAVRHVDAFGGLIVSGSIG